MPHFKLMAVPDRQAPQCIPSPRTAPVVRAFLALVAACLCTVAAGAPPARNGTVALSDGGGMLQAEALALAWVDPTGLAMVEDVVQAPDRLRPATAETVYPLGPGSALWMR